MVPLLLDPRDRRAVIAGGLQLVGNVCVGANKRHRRLVERSALRLALGKVRYDLGVAAK